MKELIKRYEEEADDLQPRDCCTTHLLGWYERFSKWLEAQLTWRPVAQKPDVDGLYVVTKRDESPRWDKSYHLVRFKNGEWKVDSFSGGYVYSYFNVPIPEPNEE